MKVIDILTLGFTWWMRGYEESCPTNEEINAAWAAYDEAKRVNGPIVVDMTLSATERLAAQMLIDRARSIAEDLEFAHCV